MGHEAEPATSKQQAPDLPSDMERNLPVTFESGLERLDLGFADDDDDRESTIRGDSPRLDDTEHTAAALHASDAAPRPPTEQRQLTTPTAVDPDTTVFFEYITGQTTVRTFAESIHDFTIVRMERKRIVVIQADGTRIVGKVGERLLGPVSVADGNRGEWGGRREEGIEVKDEYEGEWEAPVGRYDML